MKINMKYPKAAAASIGISLILVGAMLILNPAQPVKQQPETYRDLLKRLQAEGYQFRFPTENFTEKTALLIHDVDYRFSGAQVLTEIEREFGVRSVFYLRPSAGWFTQSISYFQQLEREGWKIGIQQDCLSRTDGNTTLATQLFKAQVAYMRTFFNVSSSTYHGDVEYRLDISNFDLYLNNKTVWTEQGLTEVYGLEDYSYIRDTDNHLVIPQELGNLVIVQLHADWW